MSHERPALRRAAAAAAAAAMVAACSSGSSDTSSAVASSPTVATSAGSTPVPADTAQAESVPARLPAGTDPAAQSPLPSVDPRLEIPGGDLPIAVVDAYLAEGGDLVDPAVWAARYSPIGLPEVVGRGVKVVEGLRQADWNGPSRGWRRTDELAWLLVDGRGRDAVLDEVAATAGIAGWEHTSAATVDNGANCVQRHYTHRAEATTWTVHGCDYPLYAGMLAIGVSRVGVFDTEPEPADSTVVGVLGVLAGHVRLHSTRVAFRHPAPGSTATVSTTVTLTVAEADVDVEAVTATLRDGPLAGWQTFGGEASTLLSGPTGATWTVSTAAITFDHGTRW